MNEIRIFETSGYDDGYYWDQRVYFEYKEKCFAYMNMGSGSGYIPNIEGISFTESPDERYLKDWNTANQYGFALFLAKEINKDDLNIDRLIEMADELISSGKQSIEYKEEW